MNEPAIILAIAIWIHPITGSRHVRIEWPNVSGPVVVEASADGLQWQVIAQDGGTNRYGWLIDPHAAHDLQRFYRLRRLP